MRSGLKRAEKAESEREVQQFDAPTRIAPSLGDSEAASCSTPQQLDTRPGFGTSGRMEFEHEEEPSSFCFFLYVTFN